MTQRATTPSNHRCRSAPRQTSRGGGHGGGVVFSRRREGGLKPSGCRSFVFRVLSDDLWCGVGRSGRRKRRNGGQAQLPAAPKTSGKRTPQHGVRTLTSGRHSVAERRVAEPNFAAAKAASLEFHFSLPRPSAPHSPLPMPANPAAVMPGSSWYFRQRRLALLRSGLRFMGPLPLAIYVFWVFASSYLFPKSEARRTLYSTLDEYCFPPRARQGSFDSYELIRCTLA